MTKNRGGNNGSEKRIEKTLRLTIISLLKSKMSCKIRAELGIMLVKGCAGKKRFTEHVIIFMFGAKVRNISNLYLIIIVLETLHA